ncbi:hypothetical protein BC629DRAFT_1455576 [Irpex lacteus]|nr:hypothetical protein BC629DRAFT_1455576 [Irpex lacteus]
MSIEAAYVMVSRATSLDALMILRPFKMKRIRQLKRRDSDRSRETVRLKTLGLQTQLRLLPHGSSLCTPVGLKILRNV